MAAQGLLIRKPDGSPYTHFERNSPTLGTSHPDPTDPSAREYVRTALRAIVDTYGIDGWMADFGEWVLGAFTPIMRDPRGRRPRTVGYLPWCA